VMGTRPASVLSDGRHISTIAPGGTITCKRAETPARVVVFGISDFRRTLKEKFGLTDR
jgi:NAD kinase